MEIIQTQRGFSKGKFKDQYGLVCSIQESSLATEDCIWLGIDEPKLTVFDSSMGNYVVNDLPKNWRVDSRMHLTRHQVLDLIPLLQGFVDTGSL